MYYATVSVLALILNLIINNESHKNVLKWSGEAGSQQRVTFRYSFFLTMANCYFVADILWGILYEHHENSALFPLLYSDCVFYFIFIFLTMLSWIRYIVAYLDKKGRRSKMLLYAVWSMFTMALINLVINRFYPFIFSFDENRVYIPGTGRHLAFLFQIGLYLVTSTYMFYIAKRSLGEEKHRYIAVGATCFVMDIFLIFQILNSRYPFYAMGLMIGISVIHVYVEAGERKEMRIYDQIASGLAEAYEAMYYINIETGRYREFSISQEYASLNVPVDGQDFYSETYMNIPRYVHPDDRDFARGLYTKETLLKNLEGKRSFSYKYRVMVGEEARYFLFTVMLAKDKEHLVLYERDIQDDIKAEKQMQENQKKYASFSQIAESLASNYDVIYYVDAEDDSYISYEYRTYYGQLDMQRSGDDFFADQRMVIPQIVHKTDRDLVMNFLDKDQLRNTMKSHNSSSIDYRVMTGRRSHYVRMTARKTGDNSHYIIGIENIDEEVKKEKQHLKALNTEKELARRDELTGVKNKTAYTELERSIQGNLDNHLDYLPFAIVVCDSNNLKKINDTEGHVAGDEYIKKSAAILCEIFTPSPVFRVGGDEFVAFLRGNDYTNREALLKKLREQIRENLINGNGPILASGMAEYIPENDSLVTEIFDRADRDMYEEKERLKTIEAGQRANAG
ncbi:MAG: diguanylate cyclase [Lachnospiraceae bacterium]|nr:diguanylate cyclase [Lachnospiraceae bacterium]